MNDKSRGFDIFCKGKVISVLPKLSKISILSPNDFGQTFELACAASLSEDQATIEEFNEPYLIQIGFIERTPRGRVVTENGYAHLHIDYPDNLKLL